PTQYSAEKFGESSEPAALPWDQIQSASFQTLADLNETTKLLNEMHQARMKKSPEYNYLIEDIQEFNKIDSIPKATLNQVKLKKERDEQKVKNRERVNKVLALHGKPLWKEGEPQPKLDFDFILDESLRVMADFIPMNQITAIALNSQ